MFFYSYSTVIFYLSCPTLNNIFKWIWLWLAPLNIVNIIYFCLYLIYFCFFINYIPRKYNQTREQFHEKKIFFRVFSIISIFIDLITGVLLIITAFRKDDGLDEIVYVKPKKYKKPKVKLSKDAKSQIKFLKHQKHKGLISKENYDKQVKSIIKKEKQ